MAKKNGKQYRFTNRNNMIHKNKAEKWGIEPQKVRLLIDMGAYKTQREITIEEYFKKELWRNEKIIQVDLI